MKVVRLVSLGALIAAGGWLIASGCASDDDVFQGGTAAGGPGAAGPGGGTSSGGAGGGTSSGGSGGGTSSGGAGGTGGGGTCGDFICDPAECANNSCTPDCGTTCDPMGTCGDNQCNNGEDCLSCPADCQTGCGDGCCLLGEDCQGCPADCVVVENCDPSACGNGQCNYGLSETCLNCADCFGLCDCGNESCDLPETAANCPWDCGG